MALADSVLNDAADGAVSSITHIGLASANPEPGGANEVTGGGYARLPVTWDAATGTIASLNGTLDFSGPSDGAVLYVTFHDALTGGTYLGSEALTGDQAFNNAGEYTVNDINFDANAA